MNGINTDGGPDNWKAQLDIYRDVLNRFINLSLPIHHDHRTLTIRDQEIRDAMRKLSTYPDNFLHEIRVARMQIQGFNEVRFRNITDRYFRRKGRILYSINRVAQCTLEAHDRRSNLPYVHHS